MGERVYQWAIAPLLSISLENRHRWLLIRRNVDEPAEFTGS
jgi:hypothetical protein